MADIEYQVLPVKPGCLEAFLATLVAIISVVIFLTTAIIGGRWFTIFTSMAEPVAYPAEPAFIGICYYVTGCLFLRVFFWICNRYRHY